MSQICNMKVLGWWDKFHWYFMFLKLIILVLAVWSIPVASRADSISGYQRNLLLYEGPLSENSPILDSGGSSLLARYGFWHPNQNYFDISQINQDEYHLQLSPVSGNSYTLLGILHPYYYLTNPSTQDSQFGMQIMYTPDISIPAEFLEAIVIVPSSPTTFIEARDVCVAGEIGSAGRAVKLGLAPGVVPEPSSLSLLVIGLGVLFRRCRKRD